MRYINQICVLSWSIAARHSSVLLFGCTLLKGSMLPLVDLQRHVSFKGDQDSHLDGLIVASQKKQIDDFSLKDRALVPFFDSPVEASVLQPLQGKPAHKKSHQDNVQVHSQRKANGKPATSPVQVEDSGFVNAKQRKGKGNKNASSPKQMQIAAAEVVSNAGRKHHRDPSYRNLPSLAVHAHSGPTVSGRQSPPRKRQEYNTHDSATSMGPIAPAAVKFAGPAFTNSPMPDSLPIPTTSLLRMHEAADRLAAGLML